MAGLRVPAESRYADELELLRGQDERLGRPLPPGGD